jgi:hypothetical protein
MSVLSETDDTLDQYKNDFLGADKISKTQELPWASPPVPPPGLRPGPTGRFRVTPDPLL